jgi:ribosomal protein S1
VRYRVDVGRTKFVLPGFSPLPKKGPTEMSVSTTPKTDVWHAAAAKYPVGSVLRGRVQNVTNYGLFVEIAEGVDGLVHATDPGLVLLGVPDVGERIQVRIDSFDPARRRVGLGLVSR